MWEHCVIVPRNHTLRVLLEFVDDNRTNLGWVLALLIGEAASDLECLSTSHDTLYRTHDLRVLPTAFVVLDDSSLSVVKSLLRTSVTTFGEEEEKVMTLTLRRVLVRPFSYVLHVHLSTKAQSCKPNRELTTQVDATSTPLHPYSVHHRAFRARVPCSLPSSGQQQ